MFFFVTIFKRILILSPEGLLSVIPILWALRPSASFKTWFKSAIKTSRTSSAHDVRCDEWTLLSEGKVWFEPSKNKYQMLLTLLLSEEFHNIIILCKRKPVIVNWLVGSGHPSKYTAQSARNFSSILRVHDIIPQMGNVCNELESTIPEAAVPTIVEPFVRLGQLVTIGRFILGIKRHQTYPYVSDVDGFFIYCVPSGTFPSISSLNMSLVNSQI